MNNNNFAQKSQPQSVSDSNSPLIQIGNLKTKFDTPVASNSLIRLLGDDLAARIFQQFDYWISKGSGFISNGITWIYKSVAEFITEVFPGQSDYKMRKAIKYLIEKGLVERLHLYDVHHGHNFAPKNRTYYYSINYEKFAELVKQAESAHQQKTAETPETISFLNTKKQFSSHQKSIQRKHPHRNINTNKPPIVPQEKIELGGKDDFVNSEQSNAEYQQHQVENLTRTEGQSKTPKPITLKERKLPRAVVRNKPKIAKTPKGTRPIKVETHALWSSEGEREQFRQDLTIAITNGVGKARNSTALINYVMNQVRQGNGHTYWEEWKSGKKIGFSEQREWLLAPGVVAPKFAEYLVEKLRYSHETREQALFRLRKVLNEII